MQTKKLSNDFELPVLAVGTWAIGGEYEPDYSKDKEYIEAIKTAIKLGYIHIDTAEVYGAGHTEEIVAEAIKDFDRKKIFITTKVFKTNLHYDTVINSAKNSLIRLKTNYIDLYLIHAPNPEIPIEETMKAMDYLVEQKIIKFIGVSNFSAEQMKEAQKHTKNRIVANQLKYEFWADKIDTEAIKYCQKNDIMVIAYKPFGRGRISKERIKLLPILAEKYHKSEAQIILNWLISKRNVVALFKSTSREHLKENQNIFDFQLTKEETDRMDALVHS
jgi:diketogulonate reductase-like aldo/keto reductase